MSFRSIMAAALLLCAGASRSALAQPPEDLARVAAALPAQARVAPAAPRKLLVFTLCKGFVHSSIPLGAKAIEDMGTKTGAYTATVSNDPAVFVPDNLAQFDAVCMLNTTGELFDDDKLKKSLVEFVRGGKGLVGIHAATDCFYQWSEYGEMMGGYFDGHPWGAGDTVTCKLDDPAHPLSAAFKGRGFEIQDEIYQFQPKPYSREKLRVLVSLDTAKTDMDKGGLKREDNDYPVSWARAYGSGRVFYCSLGHNESTYWNAAVLQHYLDGIQFALGDLPADVAPSASLTLEYVEQSNAVGAQLALDEGFKDLARYDTGQDPSLPKLFSELIIASHSDPARRADFENRLVGLLHAATTLEARQYAVKHLRLIGSYVCVPALAQMLADPATADDARYVLEVLPIPAAGSMLLDALRAVPDTNSVAAIGLINSLGERREAEPVPLIAAYLKSSDSTIAASAAAALGKIGGPDAEKALMTSLMTAKSDRSAPYLAALLNAADSALAGGDRDRAIAVYSVLAATGDSGQVRAAGIVGLAKSGAPNSPAAILAALAEPDATLQRGAAVAARVATLPDAARAFADGLSTLSPPPQALLLAALGDRGDAAALPAVTAAVSSENPSVSLAAVNALGKIGDASSVEQLAELAGKADGQLQSSARAALATLCGNDVDNAIVAAFEKAEPPVRRELVRALGARMSRASAPALLRAASDSDEAVRTQAFAALGELASAELLKPMVELLAIEQSDAARSEGEKAALAVIVRGADPAGSAATVLSALPDVKQGIPAYCAILRVAGKIDDPAALDALRGATALKNGDVRMTAARALAEWPTSEPMDDLLGLAESAEEAPLRDTALRGYLRMAEMPDLGGDLAPRYDAALKTARTADDRRLILASIGKQGDPKLVALVTPFADVAELKAEAALALDQLKNAKYRLHASDGAGDVGLAADGDLATRWSTGAPQKPGQWLVIDIGYAANIRGLTLDTAGSPGDYPRGYSVFLSADGKTWGDPVAKGEGGGPITEIRFPAQRARSIKIEQTGKDAGMYWSIHELKVELE